MENDAAGGGSRAKEASRRPQRLQQTLQIPAHLQILGQPPQQLQLTPQIPRALWMSHFSLVVLMIRP